MPFPDVGTSQWSRPLRDLHQARLPDRLRVHRQLLTDTSSSSRPPRTSLPTPGQRQLGLVRRGATTLRTRRSAPIGSIGHFKIGDLGNVRVVGGPRRQREPAGQGLRARHPGERSDQCSGVPSTPVLQLGAGEQRVVLHVYLANDRELTNMVYSPADDPDHDVGPPDLSCPTTRPARRYYWFIRPVQDRASRNPDPVSVNASATNAFRKVSPTVQLASPGNGSEQSDDVRFDWTDYLRHQPGARAYIGTAGQPGSSPSYQTAYLYHLQVSQSPVFSAQVTRRDRRPDDLHLDQCHAARGDALLAGPGDRRERERAPVEPDLDVEQAFGHSPPSSRRSTTPS